MPPLEFVFDYASPYSYLANTLLTKRFGGAEIEYRPVYLRGFEMFAKGVPHTASKLAWLMADLRRCAAEEGVELRPPPVFPVNGLYALRGALAAKRAGRLAEYHDAMFAAIWREARDLSPKASVAAFAEAHGLPEVAAALDDPSIKEELKATTEAFVKRGAFGVPSFYVGDELYWGHDRMHQAARAAARAAA